MPRYFFDIRKNGDVIVDHDGLDLPDARNAHRQAIRAIAELAAEEIPQDGDLKLTIGVADSNHRLLHRVHVTFEPGD